VPGEFALENMIVDDRNYSRISKDDFDSRCVDAKRKCSEPDDDGDVELDDISEHLANMIGNDSGSRDSRAADDVANVAADAGEDAPQPVTHPLPVTSSHGATKEMLEEVVVDEAAQNMSLGAVGSWSADEVAGWLREQGLPDAVLVEFESITGSDLVVLTVDDMVDGGVRRMQAKALVKMIQALRVAAVIHNESKVVEKLNAVEAELANNQSQNKDTMKLNAAEANAASLNPLVADDDSSEGGSSPPPTRVKRLGSLSAATVGSNKTNRVCIIPARSMQSKDKAIELAAELEGLHDLNDQLPTTGSPTTRSASSATTTVTSSHGDLFLLNGLGGSAAPVRNTTSLLLARTLATTQDPEVAVQLATNITTNEGLAKSQGYPVRCASSDKHLRSRMPLVSHLLA
jgi:hypothetical protein